VRVCVSNKENVSIGNMCVCVREIGERVRGRRERVSVKSGCLCMHQKVRVIVNKNVCVRVCVCARVCVFHKLIF
jgi:hypothetical protein